MSTEKDTVITESRAKALAFVQANSKRVDSEKAEDGTYKGGHVSVRTVQKSDVYGFYDEQGLSRALVDQFTDATSALSAGLANAAALDLAEKITAAKEAGEAVDHLTAKVKALAPNGAITAVVSAQRSYPVPGTEDTKIVHGAMSLRFQGPSSRHLALASLESQSLISAAMGIAS